LESKLPKTYQFYLDNKKNSSDNVGSGAEQVDAAQTNDASVNSSGLVNIGDTETIRGNLQPPSYCPNKIDKFSVILIPIFSNSTFNSEDVQFGGLDESKWFLIDATASGSHCQIDSETNVHSMN
jgi:hypothetical protein